MAFKIQSIDPAIADEVRKLHKSPQYGHPAYTDLGSDRPPCRSCFNRIEPNLEKRILFTYNHFINVDSYPSPGPIYIHENECTPFNANSTIPEYLNEMQLILEGYGPQRWLLAREMNNNQSIEFLIKSILSDLRIEYIHAYSAKAGCFVARIDRI